MLENTGPPGFLCRFLRSIYCDSTTHVEFAGAARGQFPMARGVRQGCPASGFLFAMAFDPIFRWHQDVVIPRNPDNLDFLQPAQCAYADDRAVASLSFWGLMTALAPAFRSQFELSQILLGSVCHRAVNICGHESRRIAKSSVRCKLFDTLNMLEL